MAQLLRLLLSYESTGFHEYYLHFYMVYDCRIATELALKDTNE